MAAVCGRRTLRACTTNTTAIANLFGKSSQPPVGARIGSSSSSRFSLRRSLSSPRLPVQLSAAPLHSATASALYTSLLSLHSISWGCLSEGFASTL